MLQQPVVFSYAQHIPMFAGTFLCVPTMFSYARTFICLQAVARKLWFFMCWAHEHREDDLFQVRLLLIKFYVGGEVQSHTEMSHERIKLDREIQLNSVLVR